jgi:hypothetical protein
MPRPVHLRGEEPPDDAVLVVRGGLHGLTHETVRQAGFALLSTGSPLHFDIVLADVSDETVDRLSECFAPDQPNPARA